MHDAKVGHQAQATLAALELGIRGDQVARPIVHLPLDLFVGAPQRLFRGRPLTQFATHEHTRVREHPDRQQE